MQTHQHRAEPAKLLVDFAGILPRGKALDVAMGEGRHAIFLASHGFEVEGLDRNDEAVSSCLAEAKARGLRLTARALDLENTRLPAARFDLIVCFYYLQRDLIPQMKEALKPGGMVVYETFLIDNHLQFGHPKNRDYCFAHNELLGCFRDFRVLFYHEGPIEDRTIAAQIVAQKPPDPIR